MMFLILKRMRDADARNKAIETAFAEIIMKWKVFVIWFDLYKHTIYHIFVIASRCELRFRTYRAVPWGRQISIRLGPPKC